MSVTPPEETPKRLLIVNDDERLLSTLIAIFQNVYTVVFCSNPDDASPLIRQGFRPHVIIAPFRYASLKGDTFVSDARQHIPELVCIFTVDAKEMAEMASKPLPETAYMLLNSSWPTPEIMQAVRLAFQHYRVISHNAQLTDTKEREDMVLRKIREEMRLTRAQLGEENKELAQSHVQATTVLGRVIGGVDRVHYTNHSLYTAFIAREIAVFLKLSKLDVTLLTLAALLHDVGKIGLPFSIVAADPATLSVPDRELYESHVQAGVQILRRTGLPRKVTEIVQQHHEVLDGTGFPSRLAGAILPEAQILAVSDFYHNGIFRIRPVPKSIDVPLPSQGSEEREKRTEETLAALRQKEGLYETRIVHALFAVADQVDSQAFRTFTSDLISTDWTGLFSGVVEEVIKPWGASSLTV